MSYSKSYWKVNGLKPLYTGISPVFDAEWDHDSFYNGPSEKEDRYICEFNFLSPPKYIKRRYIDCMYNYRNLSYIMHSLT